MAHRKIRICFLADGQIHGGVATSIRLLTSIHDPEKYELSFVWTNPGNIQLEYERKGFCSHVIPLGTVPNSSVIKNGKKRFSPIAMLWWIWTTIQYSVRLARVLRSQKIDIVYSNQYFHHLLGGLAGRISGVPSVWHVRMVMSQTLVGGLAARIYSVLASRLSSTVICISNAVANAFSNAARNKIVVVYNKVSDLPPPPPDRVSEIRKEFGAEKKDILVGLVSRINANKGIDVFIDAAKYVGERHSNIRFVIIGGPASPTEESLFESLKSRCQEAGLSEKVRFAGFRDDVRDLYHAMDILCACSVETEGFNYTIIEGMAAGLPTIVSRCGGQPEIVDIDRTGMIYSPKDPVELARAIEKLAFDAVTREHMGELGRKRFLRCFDKTKLSGDLERVYNLILDRRT